MKYVDIKYIENFLEEVEALYYADDGNNYPEYIENMVLNTRRILEKEKAEDR